MQLFKYLDDVGSISLDSLDSHVIIHAFLHEGGISEGFGIIRDQESVQLLQIGQMIKYVGLVVAQVANWVLAVVGVLECAGLQVWQTV